MRLVVVSNIISHIIQFQATFCMTSKENPHCGFNVAAVTIVTNPYNSHGSHIWKTWNQKPHCGLNVAFIIHIIQTICSSSFNPDYVDYSSHKQSGLKTHLIHISLPGKTTKTYCSNTTKPVSCIPKKILWTAFLYMKVCRRYTCLINFLQETCHQNFCH